MVVRNTKIKELQFPEFRKNMEEKTPVVFDNTLFPGVKYLRSANNPFNFMQFVSNIETDDYFYIIPNFCVDRDNLFKKKAMKALISSKNTFFKCYTFYDLYDRNLIKEKEEQLEYNSVLSSVFDRGIKSAVLVALNIKDNYNTRVEFVSRDPTLIKYEFQKRLIDYGHKKLKITKPCEFLDVARPLEARLI